MSNSLHMFQSFDFAIDAHILKGQLEANGIRCFILDENYVAVSPFHANAIGGVKVCIHPSQQKKALFIFNEINKAKLTNENGVVITCPRCGSSEIGGPYKSMLNFIGIFGWYLYFLFGLPPSYHFLVYRCRTCTKVFKRK